MKINESKFKFIINKLISEGIANNDYVGGAGAPVQEVIRALSVLKGKDKITKFKILGTILENLEKRGLISFLDRSGRKVFAIKGGEWVLKIDYREIDNYGEQNKGEANPENVVIWEEYAPKVIARAGDWCWIISERVIPVSSRDQRSKWLDLVGLPYMKDFYNLYDVLPPLVAILRSEKSLKFKNDELIRIFSGRNWTLYSIPELIQSDQNDYNPIVGLKDDPEWLRRIAFFCILKNHFVKNNILTPESIDSFIEDFMNNKFIKVCMRAFDDLGKNLDEIRIDNLGFGFDGRPVILDTGR